MTSPVRSITHSAAASGGVSVAWKCRVRPGPSSSRTSGWYSRWIGCELRYSHSSMASAATSGSAWYPAPTARAASARWISVSWVKRRAWKSVIPLAIGVHTGVPGPASRSAAASCAAPSASQGATTAGSSRV